VAEAAGGLLWLSGERGDPPVQGAANPAFMMASLAAATGVMVAIHARDRDPDGEGAQLDISLQEATLMAAAQTANPTFWAWQGRVPGRPGLSAALRCRDGGWVAFNPRPDRFAAFVDWARDAGVQTKLGPDDWRWARVGVPSQGNPVAAATRELAALHDREAFLERAFETDMVCLPITDFPYMERHPHYAANRQFFEIEHERLGRRLGFVRSPVDAMAREIPIRRAPVLGEHTAEVVAGLGPDREARASLASLGARSEPAAGPLRALEGIRVVDFCWVLAGPFGTRILSSFGAEVIRIESSQRPDSVRNAPGPDGKIDPDLGGLFNDANAGKRSVTLDLRQEPGREIVRRLIAKSDVVTNNFRPGALERMGLGYEDLQRLNPGIILLNMPGTHRHGPWSGRSTMGNVVMGAAGYNELTGFPGQRPRGLGVAYPDFTSPYLLATTVMAALRERSRTGRGQEIDLSQLSGTIALLGVEWMQYRATGRQPTRRANRDPNYCPHAVYPARGEDEWCAIAVETDAEWQSLCDLLERPDLAEDRRFATHAARKAHEDEVDAIVSAWTRDQDRWELAARLQQSGIAAAPVENLRDTFEVERRSASSASTTACSAPPCWASTTSPSCARSSASPSPTSPACSATTSSPEREPLLAWPALPSAAAADQDEGAVGLAGETQRELAERLEASAAPLDAEHDEVVVRCALHELGACVVGAHQLDTRRARRLVSDQYAQLTLRVAALLGTCRARHDAHEVDLRTRGPEQAAEQACTQQAVIAPPAERHEHATHLREAPAARCTHHHDVGVDACHQLLEAAPDHVVIEPAQAQQQALTTVRACDAGYLVPRVGRHRDERLRSERTRERGVQRLRDDDLEVADLGEIT
jgi:crotonobetainyl-CoA:carnitine CoA-transferase CaiB-like acyl-CoA transferase